MRAVDQAGNADPTPATRTWTIDRTAPVTTITQPAGFDSMTPLFIAHSVDEEVLRLILHNDVDFIVVDTRLVGQTVKSGSFFEGGSGYGPDAQTVKRDQVDKFAAYGVETFAGEVIRAPLVKGCACNFECRVRHRTDFEDDYYLVVGDIVAIHGFPSREPMIMYRQAGHALGPLIPGTSR